MQGLKEYSGGAIYTHGASLLIINSSFVRCAAVGRGGSMCVILNLTLSDYYGDSANAISFLYLPAVHVGNCFFDSSSSNGTTGGGCIYLQLNNTGVPGDLTLLSFPFLLFKNSVFLNSTVARGVGFDVLISAEKNEVNESIFANVYTFVSCISDFVNPNGYKIFVILSESQNNTANKEINENFFHAPLGPSENYYVRFNSNDTNFFPCGLETSPCNNISCFKLLLLLYII
jgi:hypothetical protein